MKKLILGFLENDAKVSASAQALNALPSGYHRYSKRGPRMVTVLHLAAYFRLSEAARSLLEYDRALDCKDAFHRTPLSWVALNGHETIVKLLLQHGADSDPRDKFGQMPLYLAAWNGHETVVELLLQHGAHFDMRDKDSRTPLCWASKNGNKIIV
jgi:FOG: Ankyrin repeat